MIPKHEILFIYRLRVEHHNLLSLNLHIFQGLFLQPASLGRAQGSTDPYCRCFSITLFIKFNTKNFESIQSNLTAIFT